MSETDDTLFEKRGAVGLIMLNRPNCVVRQNASFVIKTMK